MRALILVLALAAPPAAAAQTPYTDQLRLNELQAQADLDRQRAVALSNELMALEARLRAEQAIRDIQIQRALPPLLPRADSSAPPRTSTHGGTRRMSVARSPHRRSRSSHCSTRSAQRSSSTTTSTPSSMNSSDSPTRRGFPPSSESISISGF